MRNRDIFRTIGRFALSDIVHFQSTVVFEVRCTADLAIAIRGVKNTFICTIEHNELSNRIHLVMGTICENSRFHLLTSHLAAIPLDEDTATDSSKAHVVRATGSCIVIFVGRSIELISGVSLPKKLWRKGQKIPINSIFFKTLHGSATLSMKANPHATLRRSFAIIRGRRWVRRFFVSFFSWL